MQNISNKFFIYTPPKEGDVKAPSGNAPSRPPCHREFLESLTSPLKILFNLESQAPEDVHKFCQDNRLYAWFPDKEKNISVNTAVLKIPMDASARQGAIEAGMGAIFRAAQPDLAEIDRLPAALVVPLGLHSLNAARIAAAVKAYTELLERFGPSSLQSVHIYFIGGRKLLEQEKGFSLSDIMNFGLRAYCSADWERLPEDQRQEFLTNFAKTIEQSLGDTEPLPKNETSTNFGEADSAKNLWMHASKLEELRRIIPEENLHFLEVGSDQYRSDGRDSTHGNALFFLEHYFTGQRKEIEKEKNGSIWICSDNIFCPRASLIFDLYSRKFGIDVAAFSSSLSGEDHQEQSFGHLFPLLVRESACMLNEVMQAETPEWLDTHQLNEKLGLRK